MKYSHILIFIAVVFALGWLLMPGIEQPAACPLTFEQQKPLKKNALLTEVFFKARDGKDLFYRFVSHHQAGDLIILLHGSSYHGTYLLPLAEALAEHNDICIPDIRGHGKSSPPAGTCSYLGQLEDDLSDLINQLPKKYSHITLIGHSSGGGLAIRFAAGPHKNMVQQLILLTPAIVTAPTMNTPGAYAWAHVHKITLAELAALNALGITRFNTQPILTLNKPKELCDGSETLVYDYNLAVSLHPRIPYKKDCGIATPKIHILVGEFDEINNPQAFDKIFPPERITILKNVSLQREICIVHALFRRLQIQPYGLLLHVWPWHFESFGFASCEYWFCKNSIAARICYLFLCRE